MNIVGCFSKKLDDTENVVRLAKKGDQDAFMTLIDKNITAYYRVAKGILSS